MDKNLNECFCDGMEIEGWMFEQVRYYYPPKDIVYACALRYVRRYKKMTVGEWNDVVSRIAYTASGNPVNTERSLVFYCRLTRQHRPIYINKYGNVSPKYQYSQSEVERRSARIAKIRKECRACHICGQSVKESSGRFMQMRGVGVRDYAYAFVCSSKTCKRYIYNLNAKARAVVEINSLIENLKKEMSHV